MKQNKIHNIDSTGFKTPDKYFETFDKKLIDQLKNDESIEGIEASGFMVPKDYFDSVEDIILSKLNTKNTPVINLKSKKTIYYVTTIAASFAILLSIIFNTNKAISIDTIETLAIENYLYQEDYTGDDFASLFTNDNISETAFIDVTISDELLNQYLEGIDTEELFSN